MAKQQIIVPDIGSFTDVEIIEVYIQVGDTVEKDSSLIALESAKAVLDIPSPVSGTITSLAVSEGDTVSKGSLIGEIETDQQETPEITPPQQTEEPKRESKKPGPSQSLRSTYHASPSVRAAAREQGIELSELVGTGPYGRITREDLQAAGKEPSKEKQQMPSPEGQEGILQSRIQRISAEHLSESYRTIPHVNQFISADVSSLETFRREIKEGLLKREQVKLSILPFVVKAVTRALQEFPKFNAVYDEQDHRITPSDSYHIGFAVDTPEGLLVPVIRDAESKTITELALELQRLSGKAREGRLSFEELTGGTCSITSLGGIGGSYFTPIINSPQTSIIGISRIEKRPEWDGQQFVPADMLPISIAYDHRVIDGAEGARFAVYLAALLSDMRRALL